MSWIFCPFLANESGFYKIKQNDLFLWIKQRFWATTKERIEYSKNEKNLGLGSYHTSFYTTNFKSWFKEISWWTRQPTVSTSFSHCQGVGIYKLNLISCHIISMNYQIIKIRDWKLEILFWVVWKTGKWVASRLDSGLINPNLCKNKSS